MMARDALDRNYSELVCRDQSMHLGGSSVSLRFEVRCLDGLYIYLFYPLTLFPVAWLQILDPSGR